MMTYRYTCAENLDAMRTVQYSHPQPIRRCTFKSIFFFFFDSITDHYRVTKPIIYVHESKSNGKIQFSFCAIFTTPSIFPANGRKSQLLLWCARGLSVTGRSHFIRRYATGRINKHVNYVGVRKSGRFPALFQCLWTSRKWF